MINDSRSSWADVTSGIPQGSVLGPMLFICYINDMPSSVQSSIYLFADDAKLYRNISHQTTTPLHSSTTFSNWRNGQRNGSCISTRTSVRSCTSAAKTHTKTTPWAQQHWVQQPARRTLACTWTQSKVRETHRDCCEPGERNAWTHPSLVYLPRQPVSAETVYQSCQADARVCKCSMDSCHETRPNILLENVQRRATKLIPELRDRDYEDRRRALKLPSLYYRRARGDMIEAYKFTHSIYKTEQEPLQRECNTTTRGHSHKLKNNAVKRGLVPISSVTASPTDGTICGRKSSLPQA